MHTRSRTRICLLCTRMSPPGHASWDSRQLNNISAGSTTPALAAADARAICVDHDVPPSHPTTRLGKLGAEGRHVGNSYRAFQRYLESTLPLDVQPYNISLPFASRRHAGVEFRPVSLIMPHEVIAACWSNKRDHLKQMMFGKGNGGCTLESYWHRMR